MYLRFVYSKQVQGMSSREGLFQAAAELVRDPTEAQSTIAQVNLLTDWFSQYLEQPTRFSGSKSKGYYRKPSKGLSRFKPSATEHIARAYELTSILNDHGYLIEVIKEQRVGYILYEDEYQIVAEPFTETVR